MSLVSLDIESFSDWMLLIAIFVVVAQCIKQGHLVYDSIEW